MHSNMALTDTCDIELWDKDGFASIKESKKLDTDYIMRSPQVLSKVLSSADKMLSTIEQRGKLSRVIVYEGKIIGSKEKLESELSNSIGKKVIVISK